MESFSTSSFFSYVKRICYHKCRIRFTFIPNTTGHKCHIKRYHPKRHYPRAPNRCQSAPAKDRPIPAQTPSSNFMIYDLTKKTILASHALPPRQAPHTQAVFPLLHIALGSLRHDVLIAHRPIMLRLWCRRSALPLSPRIQLCHLILHFRCQIHLGLCAWGYDACSV